jgi:hypothetical protein
LITEVAVVASSEKSATWGEHGRLGQTPGYDTSERWYLLAISGAAAQLTLG